MDDEAHAIATRNAAALEAERDFDQFVERVAQSRHSTPEQIDRIAQGRVWSGKEALRLGLVDDLGGLEDAIRCAAKLAKIEKYLTTRPTAVRVRVSAKVKGSKAASLMEATIDLGGPRPRLTGLRDLTDQVSSLQSQVK